MQSKLDAEANNHEQFWWADMDEWTRPASFSKWIGCVV